MKTAELIENLKSSDNFGTSFKYSKRMVINYDAYQQIIDYLKITGWVLISESVGSNTNRTTGMVSAGSVDFIFGENENLVFSMIRRNYASKKSEFDSIEIRLIDINS